MNSSRVEQIKSELLRISQKHGGILYTADVVDFAKDPQTALHNEFIWDDAEAAKAQRLERARQIIRLCITIEHQDVPPMRAFVSLTTDRKEDGGGYRLLSAVMDDSEMRDILLEDALNELRIFRQKYSHLKQLATLWVAMDQIAAEHVEQHVEI